MLNKLIKDIKLSENFFGLWKSNFSLYIALDCCTLLMYLDSAYRRSPLESERSSESLIFDHLGRCLLVEYLPKYFNRPFILLPPHRIELQDILKTRILHTQFFSRRKQEEADFNINIRRIKEDSQIPHIIENFKRSGLKEITDKDISHVIDLVYNHFPEIYYSINFSKYIKGRFAFLKNPNYIGLPKGINIPLLSEISVESIDQFFDILNQVRSSVSKRTANYMDSMALAYLKNINHSLRDKRSAIIMVSDAISLQGALAACSKQDIDMELRCDKWLIPLVIEPSSLLPFLLCFDPSDINKTNENIVALKSEVGSDETLEEFSERSNVADSISAHTLLRDILIADDKLRMESSLRVQLIKSPIAYEFVNAFGSSAEINALLTEILQLLDCCKSSGELEKYGKKLSEQYSEYTVTVKDALSRLDKVAFSNVRPLLSMAYLFDYSGDKDLACMLSDFSLLSNLDEILNKLKALKESGDCGAFHLSAYLNYKRGQVKEAREDVENGLSQCHSDSDQRRFKYLNNIIMASTGNLNDAIDNILELAETYGDDYPRFWLRAGYLHWQKWLDGRCNGELLEKATRFTERCAGRACGKTLYEKCLLLSYANLVRFYLDSREREKAKRYWLLLEERLRTESAERLPLFSFIKCYLKLEESEGMEGDERERLCRELKADIDICMANMLAANKIGRNEYMRLFKKYNKICKDSSSGN